MIPVNSQARNQESSTSEKGQMKNQDSFKKKTFVLLLDTSFRTLVSSNQIKSNDHQNVWPKYLSHCLYSLYIMVMTGQTCASLVTQIVYCTCQPSLLESRRQNELVYYLFSNSNLGSFSR